MVIFNSYVELPEGILHFENSLDQRSHGFTVWVGLRRAFAVFAVWGGFGVLVATGLKQLAGIRN